MLGTDCGIMCSLESSSCLVFMLGTDCGIMCSLKMALIVV